MPKKNRSQTKNRRESGGSAELGRRMKQVCNQVWGGSVGKMAADLGVSHPVLYRVFSGGQSPPGILIEQLALHPEVNRDWLFTGQGLFQPGDSKLPIATEILPGDPREHEDKLSNRRFALANNYVRPTRYLLEVRPQQHVVRSETMKVVGGDLLLMETDRGEIPQDEDLDGRICGVRVKTDEGSQLRLGRLFYSREEPGTEAAFLRVDTFDADSDCVEEIGVRVADGTLHAFKRLLKRVPHGERERLIPADSPEANPILRKIDLDDIVCISMLLVRQRLSWED